MLRATGGTWLNYATTIVFQVLFAQSYGAGPEASAFVVTFGIAIAIGGLFVSTGQSLALPRLMTPAGELSAGTLKLMRNINIAASLALLALALAAAPLAGLLALRFEADEWTLAGLLRLTALFGFLQCLAGQLAAVQLARGGRFVPMVAPGLPTIFGAAFLFLTPDAPVTQTMAALNAGAVAQIALLLAATRSRLRVVDTKAGELAPLAALTLVQLALLATLSPAERVLAGLHGDAGAAHYDYALRSLGAVQQLIVGGLAMASLADWSSMRPGDKGYMHTLITRTNHGLLALVGLAGVAAVAAPAIVRFVYERGDFTGDDTQQVALVLRLALPGFVAAGISSVLIQAVLAAKRNRGAITVGLTRFATRIAFAGCLSPWGAPAVAAGYSIAELIALGFVIKQASELATASSAERLQLKRSLAVVAGTGTAVVLLLALPTGLPDAGSAVVLGLIFAGLVVGLRALPRQLPRVAANAPMEMTG